ncbi:MAG: DUF4097 domain-containing protein [Ruminococcus sp.]|nr:DUF4097 domain-containing protein [Ruminococcus sp.]
MKKFLSLCSVIAIISLNSCNIHNNMSLDFIKKNNETQKVDVKGIEKIKIDISVGDCNIIVGNSSEAVINASCEYKAVSEEKAQQAMDNTKLRCETQGDTLHIDFIDSETGKKIQNTKNLVNIMTDIEVILPDNLKSFDISTDVGDIKIRDFSGVFDISSDVGDITAKNLTITGKSDFSADVGDIDCEISELAETKLEFKSNVGDVDLSLDTITKSEIDISSDVGNIKLDTQGKSYEETYSEKGTVEQEKKIIIDGKCTVNMTADVGDIKIK